MNKQIVVCMDGTWNDPTEKTNVYRLFRLLPGTEQAIPEQGTMRAHLFKGSASVHSFYLEGVGARGRHQGALGGSMGIGLHDRVIDAFGLVSRVYLPGDKIWIFGFSRGAWSARSLAGLIAGAGLMYEAGSEDSESRAEALWFEFKHGKLEERGKRYWHDKDTMPIRLVGVWDTVGALGIPLFNGVRLVDDMEARLFEFADRDLNPRIENGRQALAIDETRSDFTPALWNPREGIRQVWFPGVHGDVGGGYRHTGLSDGALQWMVDEINGLREGLVLDTHELGDEFAPNSSEDRHDEARKLIWQLRPRCPRQIPADATLSATVLERLARRPDYRPAALKKMPGCAGFYTGPAPEEKLLPVREPLPTRRLAEPGKCFDCIVFAQKWWNAAGLEVRAGECYQISADGVWTDKTSPVDARGYASNSRILHLLEASRRVEDAPWFALVAAIHPDLALELKNPTAGNFVSGEVESLVRGVGHVDTQSQLIVTGQQAEITIEKDGFLYFFANDSAFAYSNNSGFLDVLITRTV
ncbi:DUF2235 domain-containing protein [Niveibacterium terrae]|uniref:DUF2235 domain-containing protein n=1 Tax=Niveibacterium terrae TaxID=3373598 RepID=UPI003A900F53